MTTKFNTYWFGLLGVAYVIYSILFNRYFSDPSISYWLAESAFILYVLWEIKRTGWDTLAIETAQMISWSGIKFFVLFVFTIWIMVIDWQWNIGSIPWVSSQITGFTLVLIKSLVDIPFLVTGFFLGLGLGKIANLFGPRQV